MKKIITKLLIIMLAMQILTSCSSTNSISLQVQRPAPITITTKIKKIALLNRTKPNNKTLSTIEGVLTGEGLNNNDKGNIQECINGLQNTVGKGQRYQLVLANEYLENKSTLGKDFGEALAWKEAEMLCEKYEADALLSLEFFDTDFGLNTENITPTAVDGFSVRATGTCKVRAGFRIYNIEDKNISYQNFITQTKRTTANGYSPNDAIGRLQNKNEVIKKTSYEAGQKFGGLITPLFYWENRNYFKATSPNTQKAERYAKILDWENAQKEWLQAFEKEPKPEDKGKIAYNIALTYEIQGELEKAKEWASKAFIEFGNKKAKEYTQVIEQRIFDAEKLKNQLKEE